MMNISDYSSHGGRPGPRSNEHWGKPPCSSSCCEQDHHIEYCPRSGTKDAVDGLGSRLYWYDNAHGHMPFLRNYSHLFVPRCVPLYTAYAYPLVTNPPPQQHFYTRRAERAVTTNTPSYTLAADQVPIHERLETVFRHEVARLGSYSKWTGSQSAARLAYAGFYVPKRDDPESGPGGDHSSFGAARGAAALDPLEDVVRCFICHIEVAGWCPGHNPVTVHPRLSPNCVFAKALSAAVVTADTTPVTAGGSVAMAGFGQAPARPPAIQHLGYLPLVWQPPSEEVLGTPQIDLLGPNMSEALKETCLKQEYYRLASFTEDFPIAEIVTPSALAKAGFFYTGQSDRVQCVFCKGVLRNWDAGDDPLQEHSRHFHYCRFVQGHDVKNTPLVEDPSAGAPGLIGSRPDREATERATNAVRRHTSTAALAGDVLRANMELTEAGLSELGISRAQAMHRAYAVKARRMTTFAMWPPARAAEIEALADAGFFYTGRDSQLTCFFCDKTGQSPLGVDPWRIHALLSPNCGFILQIKGQEFVDGITRSADSTNGAERSQAAAENDPEQARADANPAFAALKTRHDLWFNTGRNNPIDSREVRARLDTPTIGVLLKMGFRRDEVKLCLEKKLRNTGQDFESIAELMDGVYLMREYNSWEENEDEADEIADPRVVTPSDIPDPSTNRDNQRVPAEPHLADSSSSSAAAGGHVTEEQRQTAAPGSSLSTAGSAGGSAGTGTGTAAAGGGVGSGPGAGGSAGSGDGENDEEIQRQVTCKICMDRKVQVVFLPCGHLVCCAECAVAFPQCPMCRADIKGTVKAYMS